MKRKLLALAMAATLTVTSFSWGSNVANAASLKKSSQTTSPFIDKTYTHADAFDELNIYHGIDVSRYQGNIDWVKAKAAGVEYAFIRAGYRGYSAGTLTTDPKFEEYVEGANAAGVKVGLYFYTEAINAQEAAEEAAYCITLAKDHNISLPIAYDIEYTNKTGRMVKADLTKKQATNNCKAFCDTIEAAGYDSMIYANKSFLGSNIDGDTLDDTYKIWLANYTTSTTYTGKYEYWQYTSDGTVDGISGRVDCNFWYTDSSIDSLNATSIADAKINKVTNKKYTGKEIVPTPTLTLNGQKLKRGVDFRYIYSNNTAIGTATIKAKGIGKYKGTVKTTFKIVPKKVSTFKKKSGYKQITLSWKKHANATGYVIYRKSSYNSKTYKKVKGISKNSTTTWTNKKLKNDREYFYCIRAFTKVNGKRYYSDYTYLTAATSPSGQKTVAPKKLKLYQEPTATGTVLIKIPKKTQITYLGRTYTKGSKYSLHIKCKVNGKTYNGYVPAKTKFTF